MCRPRGLEAIGGQDSVTGVRPDDSVTRRRYHTNSMASYWIVVPRDNPELFELLSVAFRGRAGFSVIVDRRGASGASPQDERRASNAALAHDEFIIAEQAGRTADEADGAVTAAERRYVAPRVPVRRRRSRRSGYRIESGSGHARTIRVAS